MTDSHKPGATAAGEVPRRPSDRERIWEKNLLRPALQKSPERSSEFTTISGHPIERLYTPGDLAGWDPVRELGVPGEPPYTRGIHPSMYRGRLWTMRQFAGFGSAEDTNRRFRYLLSQGQNGISVAFDLPTLMGYDSDHSLAEGEVGKCGVAISSLADMEALFDQIPLGGVSTSMTIQELAFTLRDGIEYVEWGLRRGLDVDDFAPRLSFFFNAHNDFFEEIAKYRAARRVWHKTMTERFGAKSPRSWALRFHAQTAGCSLTAQQPYNNVVRTALQALAAVMGGTQSLHTNSLDEAWALPTEFAATLALRTQQIIAHETGVANTADPLGGSYFVEALTNEVERGAWDYIHKIDALGGMIAAIERSYPQREIADASYRYQMAVDRKEKIIVGVNEFTGEEKPIEVLQIGESVRASQIERLRKVRADRSSDEVNWRLAALRKAAQGDENLMPHIYEAVKSYATLGEICAALRDVFGTYEEVAVT